MRLFIGFQLTSDIVHAIVAAQDFLQDSLSSKDVVRWIPRENLHVTVAFLGRVNEGDVESIKLIMKEISRKYKKIEFIVVSLCIWPKGKLPRIVAYNLNHPAKYGQLQAELASKLVAHAPNMGALKPAHITIGRVKPVRCLLSNGANKKVKRSGANPKYIQKLATTVRDFKIPIHKLSFSSLCLFQSILSPKGSKYKNIKVYRFCDKIGVLYYGKVKKKVKEARRPTGD